MDSRLIAKFGRETLIKSSCVEKCAGCPKQFTPDPPEEGGKTFCLVYLNPAAKWPVGKTCPFMYVIKVEEERKVNPLKASKRGIKHPVSQVAAAIRRF